VRRIRVRRGTFMAMTSQLEKAARFLGLHCPGSPLLLPNPWDQGSARVLASLGFQALATTSSGFAATLGRADGSVSRDEALAHAAAIVAATDLPVSADLENCFADDPAGVARTVALAAETGLAGCSVEDFTGDDDEPIYDIGLAAERVAAAVEAAHAGPARLVLTARAENYLYRRRDLADTITRLQAYQAAGADVLYAPGLTSLAEIRQLVTAVDRPVNVLAMPGAPPVNELAAVGVSRVSVGGALAFAALGALVDAATELRDKGTYGYLASSAAGKRAVRGAVLALRRLLLEVRAALRASCCYLHGRRSVKDSGCSSTPGCRRTSAIPAVRLWSGVWRRQVGCLVGRGGLIVISAPNGAD
jgi:2-methylisocitrate lyase-like PEP mutase family enzyme